jgi:hypothetical protein
MISMKTSREIVLGMVLLIMVMVGGCFGKWELTDAVRPELETPGASIPPDTPEPTLTHTPAPTFTPSATPIVILDPEPLQVTFSTGDGVELSGLYYPAAENPAPLIILIHWARGDLTEWDQVAPWLQNRGMLVRAPDYNDSWKSSDWFPEFSPVGPLGVFAFTLRECEGGCTSYQPGEWLVDIEAAMLVASQLQGVDPGKIVTAGASIGADGALYGCAWLNRTGTGICRGSYSLSPASLLTVPYNDLVNELTGSEASIPLYCLFGLRDDASVETCSNLTGLTAVDYGYIENHGFELLRPGQDPNPLMLLNEFIRASLAGAGE